MAAKANHCSTVYVTFQYHGLYQELRTAYLTIVPQQTNKNKLKQELTLGDSTNLMFDEEEGIFMLTNREKEIIIWAAQGKNNWETARILEITEHTVHHHLKNIYRKLKVNNKTHAVTTAINNKIITLEVIQYETQKLQKNRVLAPTNH